jgi:predicted O-methyltransferase YrrM
MQSTEIDTSMLSEKKLPSDMLRLLEQPYHDTLLSMYRGEPQLGDGGIYHTIDTHTKISTKQGMYLYNFCLEVKPKAILEIGMAYGFSTIYFLAAIAKNNIGCHVAIDNAQQSYWHNIGLTHAIKLAPVTTSTEPTFTLIEDKSDRAAIDLVRENRLFDLIFVDGGHRFDDVLVDFYLYAPLCSIGGHIIFDDLWMPSIQAVVAYVRANRKDFLEISAPDEPNVRVFKKISEDRRRWDHFNNFNVIQSYE